MFRNSSDGRSFLFSQQRMFNFKETGLSFSGIDDTFRIFNNNIEPIRCFRLNKPLTVISQISVLFNININTCRCPFSHFPTTVILIRNISGINQERVR